MSPELPSWAVSLAVMASVGVCRGAWLCNALAGGLGGTGLTQLQLMLEEPSVGQVQLTRPERQLRILAPPVQQTDLTGKIEEFRARHVAGLMTIALAKNRPAR